MKKRFRVIVSICLFCVLMFNSMSIVSATSYNYPTLPSSLGITIPNVDLGKVQDNRKISDADKAYLRENYVNLDETVIEDMTIFEMTEFLLDQSLTIEDIGSARELYPELSTTDMSEWTQRMLRQIHKAKNENMFKDEELAKMGLQWHDVSYLLKEYKTIENIKTQNTNELRQKLIEYYQNKLLFAEVMVNGGANNSLMRYADDPPTNLQGTTYRWVDMPNYGEDWFHEDTMSHIPSIASQQSTEAIKLYQYIFNTTATPNEGTSYKFTNMWGTWSDSQEGAHEGLDMVYPSSSRQCRAIYAGSVSVYNASNGCVSLYSSSYGTVYYTHMNISVTSGTVAQGTPLGIQAAVGNATGTHLHFERASTSGGMSSGSDNVLNSRSPYNIGCL